MTFKARDKILTADPRFAPTYTAGGQALWPADIVDLHSALAEIDLVGAAPPEVRSAFDRARNVMLYAYFDYDLLVTGESQAYAAFELALKHRLAAHPGKPAKMLRPLVKRAREVGVLPAEQIEPGAFMDRYDAIIGMRNDLAHGTTDVHTPAMALQVLEICATEIDNLFPQSA